MASNAKRKADAKMTLEAYLLLIQSRSHLNLTASHLNQVITMHGFKKIHKVHKKLLSDTVNSLELMNPCRSTLRDNISPPGTTKMEDVMADLSNINWQECCVTGIETLGLWNQNQSAPPRNGAVQFEQYSLPHRRPQPHPFCSAAVQAEIGAEEEVHCSSGRSGEFRLTLGAF